MRTLAVESRLRHSPARIHILPINPDTGESVPTVAHDMNLLTFASYSLNILPAAPKTDETDEAARTRNCLPLRRCNRLQNLAYNNSLSSAL